MVRVIVKGGVWRNTEDEVLKAAVMKYGKNQWSRIASLLHRKSAKQCKSRWQEWLDPSIKKTEWSKEEDEKLLHLAKLMPTQWRTIAPIVGRTASQCLERYEYLLDQAQKKAEGDEGAMEDPRKLKPGEIDPTPENKPARPDPIDMDEDELEMLSEARARLANTQGKKAKRLARQKQLEEARRLAALQKRREMRMAGIGSSRSIAGRPYRRGRRTNVDYNAEIPFEKPVPAGFHDPSVDQFEFKQRQLLKNRDQEERLARQQDKEKAKKRKEEELPEAVFKKSEPDKKRSKLVLPAPQIADAEIDEIVKVGKATQAAKETAELTGDGGASTHLLSDYSFATPTVPGATGLAALRTPMRTPAASVDLVMQEAQNLLALQNVQTPLKGGVNTPLVESDFSGITPRREIVQTPNALLAAATPRGAAAAAGSATPTSFTPGGAGAGAVGGTPYRDRLNINAEEAGAIGKTLKDALRTLPRPKNDYELVAPDDEEMETESVATGADIVPDAGDLLEAAKIQQREEAERLWAEQHQAIQRGLPRPKTIAKDEFRRIVRDEFDKAAEMIRQEMLVMLHHDAVYHADESEDIIDHEKFLQRHPYMAIPKEDIEEAKLLITEETSNMEMAGVDVPTYSSLWDEFRNQMLYLPSQKRTKKDKCDALEQQLNNNRAQMGKDAKRAGKIEKKLKILLGGYQQRAQGLMRELQEHADLLEMGQLEAETFSRLKAHEAEIIPRRLERLAAEVKQQESRERELQKVFSAKQRTLQELKAIELREAATVSADPVSYDGTS